MVHATRSPGGDTMGPTVRGHFLIGGALFLWVAIWTQFGVHRHVVEESLAEDMSAMSEGIESDAVPALAHLVVGDPAITGLAAEGGACLGGLATEGSRFALQQGLKRTRTPCWAWFSIHN